MTSLGIWNLPLMDSKSLPSKKYSSERAWNGVTDEDEEAHKDERLREEGVEHLGSLEGTEDLKEEDGFAGVISKMKLLLEEELDSDSPTLASISLSPIST